MPASSAYLIEQDASLLDSIRGRFRAARAQIFHHNFPITERTTILDLGGFNGAHLAGLLSGTKADFKQCVVADVDGAALDEAEKRFGFGTLALDRPSEVLPVENKSFDIVFCSSVLEHVTFGRPEVWSVVDGAHFRKTAADRQAKFASEIRRISNGYFVQVPYRHFPLETHTRLPLFQYLRRSVQVALMKSPALRFMRQVTPDFYLPTEGEFRRYFPDARLTYERLAGVPKSLIAIRQQC